MQKKVIKVDLELYKEIDKVIKKFNYNPKSYNLAVKLEKEIDKEVNLYEAVEKQAEKVKNDFVQKAKSLGVEYQGTQNYDNLEEVIRFCQRYQKAGRKALQELNLVINNVRYI